MENGSDCVSISVIRYPSNANVSFMVVKTDRDDDWAGQRAPGNNSLHI